MNIRDKTKRMCYVNLTFQHTQKSDKKATVPGSRPESDTNRYIEAPSSIYIPTERPTIRELRTYPELYLSAFNFFFN